MDRLAPMSKLQVNIGKPLTLMRIRVIRAHTEVLFHRITNPSLLYHCGEIKHKLCKLDAKLVP